MTIHSRRHPHHKVEGWKIAFIVDVIYEEERHGRVKRVKLDIGCKWILFSSVIRAFNRSFLAARYCEHLSFFGGQMFEEDIIIRLRSTLIRYVLEYYLVLIKTSGHHCVFDHDEDKPIPGGVACPGEPDDGFGEHDCTCGHEEFCGHTGGIRWGILYRKFLEHSHCGDFDTVTAVTQGSINSAFSALWEAARKRVKALGSRHTWENYTTERDTCIADYSFTHEHHGEEIFFSACFEAPQVQLFCRDSSHKVMVYFTIGEGFFKTLGQNKCLLPG